MSVKLMQNLVKDLETELDFKLDKTQITNCITEIPQDIKLELNDGILTLKAGSKVYVPNGPGVFDGVVISADKTATQVTNGVHFVLYNTQDSVLGTSLVNVSSSGTTEPSEKYTGSYWYDTTNNLVKRWNGSSWRKCGLPLGVVTISSEAISSIDQVFNGFGYIGSTAFSLPGIKALAPNGRNDGGSLNNIEFTTSRVSIIDMANSVNFLLSVHTDSNLSQDREERWFEQVNEPGNPINGSIWYNPETNLLKQIIDGVWLIKSKVKAVKFFVNTNNQVTAFTPKLPFRAVDNSSLSQDFNQPSVYSIPSTKAVDEATAAIQIADRIYQGVDLTKKFSSEISHYSDVWTWIQARIKAGNFKGIHVGDYIPFQTTAGTVSTNSITALTYNAQIAGIDTYYGYGDTAIAHHIDFITKEVVPVEIKWNPTDNNNGTSTEQHPWLSSAAYAWLNGVNNYSTSAYNNVAHGLSNEGKGMISRLPTSLQNVIITKRQLLEKRYSASGLLTSSNGWDWCNMGKLWLPHEIEVYGCQVWSAAFPDTSVQAWASMGAVQYPLFACTGGKSHNRIKPLAGQSGTRSAWWLSAGHGGDSAHVCDVNYDGHATGNVATCIGIRVPLCFRIA